MKFKKNIVSNLILHILSIGTGFITSILIARGLGTENQGQFSYYLLIFGIIASYGHLGITSSNSYFIKKSQYEKKNVINTNISTLIFLGCIYIIIAIIFSKQIFSNNIYILPLIWLLYAINLLFNNFFITVYVSDENIYVYNKYLIAINILKGILIVILYFINCLNIVTLSLIYASLEILKIALLLKGLKLNYHFEFNINIIKDELKFGIPLYLAALCIYLNYRVDQFMVKQMLGTVELGIYAISVNLAELAFVFPESITSAFEGRLYTCKKEERDEITIQTIKLAFYLTLMICIVGCICKPLVTVLYGQEYSAAGVSMVILLIGIIFASIGKVTPAYFYTNGNPGMHLKVSAIVLAVNVLFNMILIPRFGINGAALASTISYFVYGAIYIIVLKKKGFNIKEIFKINKNDLKIIINQTVGILRKGKNNNG